MKSVLRGVDTSDKIEVMVERSSYHQGSSTAAQGGGQKRYGKMTGDKQGSKCGGGGGGLFSRFIHAPPPACDGLGSSRIHRATSTFQGKRKMLHGQTQQTGKDHHPGLKGITEIGSDHHLRGGQVVEIVKIPDPTRTQVVVGVELSN